MSVNDVHVHWQNRPRDGGLREELAADVAAFLRQPGNRITRIPDGVSGLDENGMPKARSKGYGRSEIPGQADPIRGGNAAPRKPDIDSAQADAVLRIVADLAVPVRANARPANGRTVAETARLRVAAGALFELGAAGRQVARVLEAPADTVYTWLRTLTPLEAQCAGDVVREVRAEFPG